MKKYYQNRYYKSLTIETLNRLGFKYRPETKNVRGGYYDENIDILLLNHSIFITKGKFQRVLHYQTVERFLSSLDCFLNDIEKEDDKNG